MSKKDIIKIIEEIDKQLKQNRQCVINHADSVDVGVLCKLSMLLLDSRQQWKDILLEKYGVYYR